MKWARCNLDGQPVHPGDQEALDEFRKFLKTTRKVQVMPYKVEEKDGDFCVVNTETGEVKAEHEVREDAERQVRLLNELEKEGEPE